MEAWPSPKKTSKKAHQNSKKLVKRNGNLGSFKTKSSFYKNSKPPRLPEGFGCPLVGQSFSQDLHTAAAFVGSKIRGSALKEKETLVDKKGKHRLIKKETPLALKERCSQKEKGISQRA